MKRADKEELKRLVRRIATETARSATLTSVALRDYADGETDKANEKGRLANNAMKEAEAAYQEFRNMLDGM